MEFKLDDERDANETKKNENGAKRKMNSEIKMKKKKKKKNRLFVRRHRTHYYTLFLHGKLAPMNLHISYFIG